MCERKSRGNPRLRSRAWINGSIEHSEGLFLHNLSLVIPNDSLGREVAIQGGTEIGMLGENTVYPLCSITPLWTDP